MAFKNIEVDDGIVLEPLVAYHAEPLLKLIHTNRDHFRRFLTWVNMMQNRVAAIGHWLTAALEGKGILTRCCRAIIDYGFKNYDLNRIEIKAVISNTKSQAIPERLGFTREGVMRQAKLLNEKMRTWHFFRCWGRTGTVEI